MFKHLLVFLDGFSLAECMLPHTVAFAQAFEAKVTLLRVLANLTRGMPVDAFDWQMAKAEAEADVDSIAGRLRAAGVQTETVVLTGEPATCVINYVHTHPVDLLILSSHGESGLTGWNSGGVEQKILQCSHISCLLVRADQPAPTEQTDLRYRHLLVPLDGSPRAECVLSFAATLARFYDAQLLLIHVLRPPEMPRHVPLLSAERALAEQLMTCNGEAVGKLFAQLKSQLPAATEIRLLERADVAAGLQEIAASEQVDLVILSAHGYSGSSRWPYGSVTVNFITNGKTPLLIVQDLVADKTPTMWEGTAGKDSKHMMSR